MGRKSKKEGIYAYIWASQVALVVKNPAVSAEDRRDAGLEDPLEERMATHSNIVPGESHGQRSLVGYSPWGHKESDRAEVTQHAGTHAHILLIHFAAQ